MNVLSYLNNSFISPFIRSYSVGYAFAYGGSDYNDPSKTFIGTENFFLKGADDLTFWLFQFAFAATRLVDTSFSLIRL